jgi:hypothetical protein
LESWQSVSAVAASHWQVAVSWPQAISSVAPVLQVSTVQGMPSLQTASVWLWAQVRFSLQMSTVQTLVSSQPAAAVSAVHSQASSTTSHAPA